METSFYLIDADRRLSTRPRREMLTKHEFKNWQLQFRSLACLTMSAR